MSEPTRGQAARRAWQDWCAGAVQRGRGKPGYDEQADTDAGWEVAADAGIGASGLRAQLEEARRELAEVRELAHNVHDVRRIDALTAERDSAREALDKVRRGLECADTEEPLDDDELIAIARKGLGLPGAEPHGYDAEGRWP